MPHGIAPVFILRCELMEAGSGDTVILFQVMTTRTHPDRTGLFPSLRGPSCESGCESSVAAAELTGTNQWKRLCCWSCSLQHRFSC